MQESFMRPSDKQLAPALSCIEGEADVCDTLPLRLIDVLSTISCSDKGNIIFTEGGSRGWDFHVISHTWSKGIRDLSEQIGKHVVNTRQLQAATQLQEEILSAMSGRSNSSPLPCIITKGDAYSHAFKEADFSQVSSYQQLQQFLQLLAGDGVKYIWFDALCIDQTDVEEKSREIGNMGAYYQRSQGCYVLTHGVGEGYQLWGKEGPRGLELPRWFSRVWTLQEFLLPRRLSFFVEGLDPRFLVFVNKLARVKSKSGLYCRCFCEWPHEEHHELVKSICDGDDQLDSSWALQALDLRDESMKKADLDDDDEETESFNSEGLSKRSVKLLLEAWNSESFSRPEFLQLYMQLISQDREKFEAAQVHEAPRSLIKPLLLPILDGTPNEEANKPVSFTAQAADQKAEGEAVLSVNGVCAHCQSPPMIRKAQIDAPNASNSEGSNKGTVYLVDREAYLGVMHCDSKMTKPPPSENTKGVQELRGLYARLSSTHTWTAWDVIVELGRRNCTVEEDRVLGILGLLGKGAGERSQLRSGNRLQDQIRELARVCSPEVLVELCGMDVRACSIPGMSWAPDFHNPTCHDFWFTHVQRELRDGQSLSVDAERVSVTATGALKLRAKVVSAYVLPVTALPASLQNTSFIKFFLSCYASKLCSHFIVISPPSPAPPAGLLHHSNGHSHHVLPSIPPRLNDSYGLIPLCCIPDGGSPFIKFEFHFSVSHTHRGCMHLPIITSTRSATAVTTANQLEYNTNLLDVNEMWFEVEMVLLAGTNRTQCGDKLQLIMLCLKSAAAAAYNCTSKEAKQSEQELHKIGMLSLITDPDEDFDHYIEVQRPQFESASMQECSIGGFGADLRAHILTHP